MKHFIIGSKIKYYGGREFGYFVSGCGHYPSRRHVRFSTNEVSLTKQYLVYSTKRELLYCGYDKHCAEIILSNNESSILEVKDCLLPDSFFIIGLNPENAFAVVPKEFKNPDNRCLLFCGLDSLDGFSSPYTIRHKEGGEILYNDGDLDNFQRSVSRDVVAVLYPEERVSFECFHDSETKIISYIWTGETIVEERKKKPQSEYDITEVD